MKLFKFHVVGDDAYKIKQEAIFQLFLNPNDNNVPSVRFVYYSPIIKDREYLDPIDYIKKLGATRMARSYLLRRPKGQRKLTLVRTGSIVAPVR